MWKKKELKTLYKRIILAIPLAAAIVLIFFRSGASAMSHEICQECHEEMAAAFPSTFHGRIWTAKGAVENGCQSCHGSAERHADDPSRETIITFGEKSLQSAEGQSARCLNCHASSSNLAYWDMGKHGRNDVACVSCHSIHIIRMVVKQPATCFRCHNSIRLQANKQSHHPIVEGKIKCSDCHNQHGTLSRAMIRADSINQLCYQCHADKRGPFIWEHPPVEERCTICHTPHGSRHAKLMVEKIPNLCQDCHDWSRHPGTPYTGEDGFAGNANSRFIARSCLNCHGAIHGSSHFEFHEFRR